MNIKKLLSILLSLAIILSVVGVVAITSSATTIQPDASLLTDTTDFEQNLTSIELSEKMITGYNIGNNFESHELEYSYSRPPITNIQDYIKYKETMWGMIPISEDFIKYLAENGIQAVRLPVTWFSALTYTGELNGKTYNGEIPDKSVHFASITERRKLWYNGVIAKEFLDRVQQVVDWIIKYGMYCIINTHHDGACNNANAMNPEKFGSAVVSGQTGNEQTIQYLTNIWGQVGERFKNYGSKLLFEPFNEVADETGQMTASAERQNYAAEVSAAFIQQIRSQGGNNDKRFLVIPNYGGISFIYDSTALETIKSADTVNGVYNDKIILTTHYYGDNMKDACNSARNIKKNKGIGATVDEIGLSGKSSISDDEVTAMQTLYNYSHQEKISCFFWDNGDGDFSVTNRYYNEPSSEAFLKYVGSNEEYRTYTQSEILALTGDSQPNWMKLYSENSTNAFGGKYLIITSEKPITSLTKSGNTWMGYYAINGANNGLVTQFVSDDGINYKMRNTVIPTTWTRTAWNTYSAYGTTYYAEQLDGSYFLSKIGDGLQKYVTTGDELISTYAGELRDGGYDYSNGGYVSTAGNRICYTNKINVTPGEWYYFTASTNKRYQLLIRAYDANGSRVTNLDGVTKTAKLQMPSNVYKISVTIYDSYQSLSYDNLYALVDDGTIAPTMYHYVSPDADPDPTSPTTEPTEPTSEPVDLSVEMTTVEGASIRLNNKAGLRFYTEVDKDKVAQLRNEGYTVQLGTLVAPTDLLLNNALTFDLQAGIFADIKYLANEYYEENGFSGIVGSIVDIKESTILNPTTGNILRDFVARGYAKITSPTNETTIVYANYNKVSARSLGQVAYMFREDNMNNELYLANKTNVDRWADAYEDKYDPEADDIWD